MGVGTFEVRFHVVLTTHERCDLLARTLSSLAAAARPEGFERVVVVENGANEGARAVCERHASQLPLAYHRVAHPGKSRALQWAVSQLRTGFVLFLDDDVRVAPELLESYAEAAREHGAGHFYGGPLSIDYEVEPPHWLLRHLPPSARGWEPGSERDPLPGGDRFLGANFGAFAEDLLAVGGFDPHLGPGALRPGTADNPTGQERAIQDRMLEAGLRPVYVPRARVWHYVPAERCSERWALHRWFRMSSSRRMLGELRHPTPGVRWLGAPLGLWGDLARAAVSVGAAGLAGDAQRRFRARRRFHTIRGEIRGHQLARARSKGAWPGGDGPQHESTV